MFESNQYPPAFYETIIERTLSNVLKKDDPQLDKSKILMVGDTLHTDILGATKFGIDTVLVLSGNTSRMDVEWMIKASGISPDYVCESIVT